MRVDVIGRGLLDFIQGDGALQEFDLGGEFSSIGHGKVGLANSSRANGLADLVGNGSIFSSRVRARDRVVAPSETRCANYLSPGVVTVVPVKPELKPAGGRTVAARSSCATKLACACSSAVNRNKSC